MRFAFQERLTQDLGVTSRSGHVRQTRRMLAARLSSRAMQDKGRARSTAGDAAVCVHCHKRKAGVRLSGEPAAQCKGCLGPQRDRRRARLADWKAAWDLAVSHKREPPCKECFGKDDVRPCTWVEKRGRRGRWLTLCEECNEQHKEQRRRSDRRRRQRERDQRLHPEKLRRRHRDRGSTRAALRPTATRTTRARTSEAADAVRNAPFSFL